MKITIGITTFNRKDYLLKFKESLYLSNGLDECNIMICDDCSSEFEYSELKQWFPDAKIVVRPYNLGADKNMRQMYIDFLETDNDILVNMDSDLLCRPDWLNFIQKNFQYTDGIMSLFNSVFHRPKNEIILNGVKFVEKEHIGAAGAILNRDIVKKVLSVPQPLKWYDKAWSEFLSKNGIRLLVSENSYFQHIGIIGTNSTLNDFAFSFYPAHSTNMRFLAEWQYQKHALYDS